MCGANGTVPPGREGAQQRGEGGIANEWPARPSSSSCRPGPLRVEVTPLIIALAKPARTYPVSQRRVAGSWVTVAKGGSRGSARQGLGLV